MANKNNRTDKLKLHRSVEVDTSVQSYLQGERRKYMLSSPSCCCCRSTEFYPRARSVHQNEFMMTHIFHVCINENLVDDLLTIFKIYNIRENSNYTN